MCYDSSYYEWARRAAQMKEEQKREEERKKQARSAAPAKPAEPEKGSIREALGRAWYLCGRAARARREFAKAVQIDPVNDYAHFGLGLSCARTGQRDRAIGHLKLALAMRPGTKEYQEALDRVQR